eukprot:TRINITY_DN2548_c0_g1_i11.p1 TRINITY_DN2548_c0_g1~~TRINITY_DN2548_c0_g1_i11.p1  ORF type:complete len:924 (+),score=262.60 TRINITY_DN2548_c0_g1_i11:3438-6209(+)
MAKVLAVFFLFVCLTFSQTCGPRIRRAWDTLSEQERQLYIDAVLLLKQTRGSKTNLFDEYQNMHNDQTNRVYAHGAPGFFPWHRVYLYKFENELRNLGPRFRCITVPYWPWERFAGREVNSTIFGPNYFGTIGSIDASTKCITDSKFSAWGLNGGTCITRTFDAMYSFVGEARVADIIANNPSYGTTGGYRSLIEGAPHAGVHNWAGARGGLMGTMNSPGDPIFYLHHSNVDRLYAIWQDCHDYDKLTTLSSTSFSGQATTAMPFLYGGSTHPSFTDQTYSPTDAWFINTPKLPYAYDTTDSLVDILSAAGSVCKFHWFAKPATQKRAETSSSEEAVPFSDLRVKQQYEDVCERFPTYSPGDQLHLTAYAECNICTGHGQKWHACPEWIKMSHMEKEAYVFDPICRSQKKDFESDWNNRFDIFTHYMDPNSSPASSSSSAYGDDSSSAYGSSDTSSAYGSPDTSAASYGDSSNSYGSDSSSSSSDYGSATTSTPTPSSRWTVKYASVQSVPNDEEESKPEAKKSSPKDSFFGGFGFDFEKVYQRYQPQEDEDYEPEEPEPEYGYDDDHEDYEPQYGYGDEKQEPEHGYDDDHEDYGYGDYEPEYESYGYGDDHEDYEPEYKSYGYDDHEDYGYGDYEPEYKSYGYDDDHVDYGYGDYEPEYKSYGYDDDHEDYGYGDYEPEYKSYYGYDDDHEDYEPEYKSYGYGDDHEDYEPEYKSYYGYGDDHEDYEPEYKSYYGYDDDHEDYEPEYKSYYGYGDDHEDYEPEYKSYGKDDSKKKFSIVEDEDYGYGYGDYEPEYKSYGYDDDHEDYEPEHNDYKPKYRNDDHEDDHEDYTPTHKKHDTKRESKYAVQKPQKHVKSHSKKEDYTPEYNVEKPKLKKQTKPHHEESHDDDDNKHSKGKHSRNDDDEVKPRHGKKHSKKSRKY